MDGGFRIYLVLIIQKDFFFDSEPLQHLLTLPPKKTTATNKLMSSQFSFASFIRCVNVCVCVCGYVYVCVYICIYNIC